MTDDRIAAFESALRRIAGASVRSASGSCDEREGRQHRFLRDLAAEILHNTLPEHYPLMTRWVWDAKPTPA